MAGPTPLLQTAPAPQSEPELSSAYTRPVSYQGFPDSGLPAELQNTNPLGIARLVNGETRVLESRGLSFRSSHRAMSKEVLIVGGGVVGLSIAYYLASTNHSVRIIERDDSLAKSCSEGNRRYGGPFSLHSTCCSWRHLSGIKNGCSIRKSPFYLRPRLSPSLARWIWLFTKHSTKRHVSDTQELLRDLSLESRRPTRRTFEK